MFHKFIVFDLGPKFWDTSITQDLWWLGDNIFQYTA